MSEAKGPEISASVEVLRKLKAIEGEWDAKLAAVKAEGVQKLAKAREAAEAKIAAARGDVDRWREVQLVASRSEAQSETEKIRSDGERAAAELSSAASKGKAVSKKVLDAVLGDFRADGGK